MKGGITSGVVYPMAGIELAKLYTLKNIGGASAGAIAAALFAAAEYRRGWQQSSAGFDELAGLPTWFGQTISGGRSNLLSLFQPERTTRGLFCVLIACLGPSGWRKVARASLSLILAYPVYAIPGFLPAGVLAALGAREIISWHLAAPPAALLAVALLFLVLGTAAAALAAAFAVAFAVKGLPALSKNGFGLCSGTGSREPGGPPPLTEWIEQSLDRIAFGDSGNVRRRPDGYRLNDPLTFADLWNATTIADRERLEQVKDSRQINLEVMTTNLTQGRPYRIPLETHLLFFKPSEFATLFPPRIVEFLTRNARPPHQDEDRPLFEEAAAAGLLPFPRPADVPVAVAVRMSLSFPLLISAVPVWSFDFSYAAKNENGFPGKPKLAPCWFSDGGITSNFPVHFFDGPLPTWPTFALNLTPFHPHFPYNSTDETKNIWLPSTNGGGMSETWSYPDANASALGRLAWFVGAITNTIHNWHDNIQLKVPGYRDRIAQIHLRDSEGGMNLTMPASRIGALSERGAYAAKQLATQFSNAPLLGTVLTWDNHRWVRYRSTMSLLQQEFTKIDTALRTSQGVTPYLTIALNPPSYPFPHPNIAASMLVAFATLRSSWSQRSDELMDRAPAPTPELRVAPRT